MEPLPETVDALRELTRRGDEAVARTLLEISREVERLVPSVVGVSLSLVAEDLTFTMTATAGPVAQMDGMQYLAGGPCDETLHTGRPHAYRGDDPADEERWALFARATAAQGVAATLSLPILHDGAVIAGVNLYAAAPDAFDGRHDELAAACGAWSAGAVSNADLDFTSRFRAAEAPERLRGDLDVDRAVGAMMAHWDLTTDEAEERLRSAARRSGLSDAQIARAVLALLTGTDGPEDPPPSM